LRPKWKSAPTTISFVAEALHEHPLDERQRRLLRLRFVEGQHDGSVDPGLLEQLEALFVVGEQLRGRLGSDDDRRVPVEGDDRRPAAALGGPATHLLDHGLMTEVEAVVGPDRDHGLLAGERLDGGIGDDEHGTGTYPAAAVGSTTDGLASSVAERLVHRDQVARPGPNTAHGPSPSSIGRRQDAAVGDEPGEVGVGGLGGQAAHRGATGRSSHCRAVPPRRS
jgi:hypothetical protein